jgi:hypothetical protein
VSGWIYQDDARLGGDPMNAGLSPGSNGWKGHTMIGTLRLDALQTIMEHLSNTGVAGDVIECGAWKGGAPIFMKGIVNALGEGQLKRVIVADSFQGFAAGQGTKGKDSDGWAKMDFKVAGGAEAVNATFERYGLLDDGVVLLPGFFNDTLPGFSRTGRAALPADATPEELAAAARRPPHRFQLSLIRMDSDLYQSTMDVLTHLYPHMSKGGVVVQNNWQYTAARAATVEFRRMQGLTNEKHPMHLIDMGSAYWIV